MSAINFLEEQKKELENQLRVLWSQVNYCEDIETSSAAISDYLLKMKEIYLNYTTNENYITLIAEKTKQKIDEQLTLFLDGLQKMIQLKENFTEMNARIEELNEENEDVESQLKETFDLLKDVSLHTKILAINANIEAHRLGEQGSVFKIIASEVRKLSDLTNTSSVNITDTTSQLTTQTAEMTQIINDNNQTLISVVQELELGKKSFVSMYEDSDRIVNESLVLDETLKNLYDLIQKVYMMIEYSKMSYTNVKKILTEQAELTQKMIDNINKELGIKEKESNADMTINLYDEFYKNFKEENLERCVTLIKQALDQGIEADFLTNHILERSVETIGKEQIDRDVPLTEIYMNGKIIEACLDILLPIIENDANMPKLGKVIIGNAFGDYHGLGIRIISTFLRMGGFDVTDLGLSVPNEKFVEEAKKTKARLICVSALILHTAEEVKKLRKMLDKNGLSHVKILVGGAPFNFEPRLVERFKADATAANGIEAIKVAKELLGIK